ncbi:N-terminal cleavage protein [Opitutaceae bacterium TAV5]|nr:N-terminal cleavage protein [Opitutaceae bacterium TAV5]
MNNSFRFHPNPSLSTDIGFPSSASRQPIRAFTLIELLTVIAIIGILAAIIIPVVGKVRESARKMQSISNVRSAAQAALLYANDNKDALPHERDTNLGTYSIVARNALEPYFPFKSEAWYDPKVVKLQNRDNYAYGSADYLWRGRIRYNEGLTGGLVTYGNKRGLPIRVSTIVRASDAFLYAVFTSNGTGGQYGGFSPVGFADGSVKMVKDNGDPNKSPSVIADYRNNSVPEQPYGLRGFDW